MRKIVNPSENVRLEGIAESDGVGFRAIKAAGPMVAMNCGYFASADADGNITTQKMSEGNLIITNYIEEDEFESEMDKKIKVSAKTSIFITILMTIGCIIMAFVSTSWSSGEIWSTIFFCLAFMMIAASTISKGITIFVSNLLGNAKMRSFSQYLAAKNAAQNAYYDLGRVPNIEEVKDYSIFSTDCKYMKNAYYATMFIIMSLIAPLDGGWYWLAAILAIIILGVLQWKYQLAFWQFLIVKEPKDVHYEVALRSLEENVEWIDHLNIGIKTVVNPDPEKFSEEKCPKTCPAYDFCKEVSMMQKNDDDESITDDGDNLTVAEEIAIDTVTES